MFKKLILAEVVLGLTTLVATLLLPTESAAAPDEQAASPSGFISTFATAIWLSDDGAGNRTAFYFFVTENSGRSNYPGENVWFYFVRHNQATGTTTYMAGGSNAPNGQFFATAASATLTANLPVVECVFVRGDVTFFPPPPGPLPDNCATQALQLDLDMTANGPQDQTHQVIHWDSPDCRGTNDFNSRTVPVLATGAIMNGQVDLTGGVPGSGLIAHDVESRVQIGPCPDPD
ncbi:MAG: hypothetical protein E6I38_13555 [Chloroflexi bacterium]|nr:MAG: hypothetical protein E6I38_13555 [Chloroflexota bacterium]